MRDKLIKYYRPQKTICFSLKIPPKPLTIYSKTGDE